eukprot:6378451-Prymnesium_polylepis.1
MALHLEGSNLEINNSSSRVKTLRSLRTSPGVQPGDLKMMTLMHDADLAFLQRASMIGHEEEDMRVRDYKFGAAERVVMVARGALEFRIE